MFHTRKMVDGGMRYVDIESCSTLGRWLMEE